MSKTINLPSGKIATVKAGKGYDLLQAQQKAKSSEEIPYALIAELCEIDGLKLVHEDILELDLADVLTLQAEISGKFQAVSLQVNQSSTYAGQQGGSIPNSEECPSENSSIGAVNQ